MNKIEILADALEYIECHLSEDIKTEDVAAACYCSKASLEKMFRCINRISVREYLIRRRMMLAAKTIFSAPKENLLDVALACGYSTNESFSRAFKSVWNCNPSEFRLNTRYSELYPRIYPPMRKGDTYSMHKNVDISELYDLFKQRKNCYFICCDVKHLMPINDISFKAGDLVILETLKRLERQAGADDIVFRIGGDEFTVLTNSEDIQYAEEVRERIKACNGETVSFEDKEIPVYLHTVIVKPKLERLGYDVLFEELHSVLEENKK
ncbi:MAG: helix-turn-helix domain-containing protein [Lachnospiraceae bacterium]|nr:helix-turn-helix domain-containing protein [Lachnospiraceae bacterium]